MAVYGVFVAKMLLLTRKGLPGWIIPLAGGLLFTGFVGLWFTSAEFRGDRIHRLHHTTSSDGVNWSEPSEPLLENAYAPSVLKTNKGYEMWYTDVTKFPWKIRHATSPDGLAEICGD